MEKIFTVGYPDSSGIKILGFDAIPMSESGADDEIWYHDFAIGIFNDREVEKLVFDLYGQEEQEMRMLKLAHHIRLSLTDLGKNALVPILFTAQEALDFQRIVTDSGNWGHILATKGVAFEPYYLAKAGIEHLEKLTPEEYKEKFLDIINIMPDATIGNHSIANEWGAFALDKAAKTSALYGNDNFGKIFQKLYFKYILAHNDYNLSKGDGDNNSETSRSENSVGDLINAKDKKILLIDDEASKGWEQVLRQIFKSCADFQVISEQVADYESLSDGAKKLIEQDFDLYLLDLRLNGVQEEDTNEIGSFSGTKVLEKIKERNKGNQVIIFTASNKAWNFKKLLEKGADAYYIKESPEYKFSPKESAVNYTNFKKAAEICLERWYLKNTYGTHKVVSDYIKEIKKDGSFRKLSNSYRAFFTRAIPSLDLCFELLKSASNEKKYFNFTYLAYYQILEDFVSMNENFRNGTDKCSYVGEKKVIDNIGEKSKLLLRSEKIEKSFRYYRLGEEVKKIEKDIGSLAKVSFVLAYKYNKKDDELENWGRLNWIRNKKAVHANKNEYANENDILELLKIVELFLTNP